MIEELRLQLIRVHKSDLGALLCSIGSVIPICFGLENVLVADRKPCVSILRRQLGKNGKAMPSKAEAQTNENPKQL
jgi:hypothetical protein